MHQCSDIPFIGSGYFWPSVFSHLRNHSLFLAFLMRNLTYKKKKLIWEKRHSSVGVSYRLELCIRRNDLTWNSHFTFTQLTFQMEAYILIKTLIMCRISQVCVCMSVCRGNILTAYICLINKDLIFILACNTISIFETITHISYSSKCNRYFSRAK